MLNWARLPRSGIIWITSRGIMQIKNRQEIGVACGSYARAFASVPLHIVMSIGTMAEPGASQGKAARCFPRATFVFYSSFIFTKFSLKYTRASFYLFFTLGAATRVTCRPSLTRGLHLIANESTKTNMWHMSFEADG